MVGALVPHVASTLWLIPALPLAGAAINLFVGNRLGKWAGILATALCPGFVRTPLVEAQIAAQAKAHGVSEERVLSDVIVAPHAIKRLLEPAEVAEVVAFLIGPGGAGFTGAAVPMDLGWTAR